MPGQLLRNRFPQCLLAIFTRRDSNDDHKEVGKLSFRKQPRGVNCFIPCAFHVIFCLNKITSLPILPLYGSTVRQKGVLVHKVFFSQINTVQQRQSSTFAKSHKLH